ncbi:ROK family transcriptional regulator [Shouchella shacheensis]|uniref:ROK family transcriptional regulator n=1 Tax=Shouchella shacheensis TaxID=1649580 RepID=UPI000ADF8E47|nr:ROK family transcriptional regulator [Shouchella shacheensis]
MPIVDHELMKDFNKSTVFRLIKTHHPISRAEIAKKSGLNKATVSTLVSQLIDAQFVYEIGTGHSSGGRKPVLLYYNQAASYAVSIDIGVNSLIGVLTDLSGKILFQESTQLTSRAFKNVLTETESLIHTLIKKAPASPYGICGIAIGVPGIIESDGKILLAPNLGWEDVDLKTPLEQTFQIPVVVENEANAGAYGEKLYGAGKAFSNLAYVSISVGIGTGQIINEQIFKGGKGYAGEFGHMSIDLNGKRCRCGNKGCWELYCSENILLETAASKLGMKAIRFEEILAKANAQNPQVLNVLASVGHSLGVGLISIMHTMNPEAIIIGNRFSLLKDFLLNPILDVLTKQLPSYQQNATSILFSELGQTSSVLGGASFVIEQFLNSHRINFSIS